MKFKSYFNISDTDPGIYAIHDIHQKTGKLIEAKTIDVHSSEIILYGYLNAADLLIKNYSKHPNYINLDNLLFPILFIYLSIIEFCLKIILNKLIEHKNLGCPFLLANIPNIIKNHKLNALFISLKGIFNINKTLPSKHLFKDIQLLEHIVNEFEMNHIESVTIRYITNHNDQLYEIYKNGITCNFTALHMDIKKIADSTINYIGSFELVFCSTGEYNQKRYDELIRIYELMLKFKNLTKDYRHKHNVSKQRRVKAKIKKGGDPKLFTINDIDFSLLEHRNYYNFNNFSDEELSLLVMGVYFNQYPWEPLISLKKINKWSQKEKIRQLDKRVVNINKGIENLKKHIKRVKKIIGQ